MIDHTKLKPGDKLYFKGEKIDGKSETGSAHSLFAKFYDNPVSFVRITEVDYGNMVILVLSSKTGREVKFSLSYFGLERYS
jgi:hypothetical protein